MKSLLNKFSLWFSARSPHEQRMLTIGAVVLALAALYSFSEWLWKENQRLTRQFPINEQQLTQMQEQASELQNLRRAAPRPAVTLSVLAQSVEASATSFTIRATVKPAINLIEVNGSGAPAMLINWIASLQADHGLRPLNLSIQAPATPDGLAEFTATFTPAASAS